MRGTAGGRASGEGPDLEGEQQQSIHYGPPHKLDGRGLVPSREGGQAAAHSGGQAGVHQPVPPPVHSHRVTLTRLCARARSCELRDSRTSVPAAAGVAHQW